MEDNGDTKRIIFRRVSRDTDIHPPALSLPVEEIVARGAQGIPAGDLLVFVTDSRFSSQRDDLIRQAAASIAETQPEELSQMIIPAAQSALECQQLAVINGVTEIIGLRALQRLQEFRSRIGPSLSVDDTVQKFKQAGVIERGGANVYNPFASLQSLLQPGTFIVHASGREHGIGHATTYLPIRSLRDGIALGHLDSLSGNRFGTKTEVSLLEYVQMIANGLAKNEPFYGAKLFTLTVAPIQQWRI